MDKEVFYDHFLLPQSSLYFITEQIVEEKISPTYVEYVLVQKNFALIIIPIYNNAKNYCILQSLFSQSVKYFYFIMKIT